MCFNNTTLVAQEDGGESLSNVPPLPSEVPWPNEDLMSSSDGAPPGLTVERKIPELPAPEEYISPVKNLAKLIELELASKGYGCTVVASSVSEIPPVPPPFRPALVLDQALEPTPAPPSMPTCVSIGSLGHPHTCAPACKYHTKGGRCKDGRYCARCHLCSWNKYGNSEASKTVKATPELAPLVPPSVGSCGPGMKCQDACKYFRRKDGCRDGSQCTKCHVCPWVRRNNSPSSMKPLCAPLPPGLVPGQHLV